MKHDSLSSSTYIVKLDYFIVVLINYNCVIFIDAATNGALIEETSTENLSFYLEKMRFSETYIVPI